MSLVRFLIVIITLFISSCGSEEEASPPRSIQTQEQEETPIQYTLTINASEGGSVSSSGGTYDAGHSITLIALPQEGYNFIGWIGDVSHTDVSLTLTINSNLSLTAQFEPIPIVYFQTKSPNYPIINHTTGTYKNNFYHPARLLTSEEILNQIWIQENCDCLGCGCRTSFTLESSKFIDFNNDNKLDLFGFLRNDSDGYAVGWGKYFLIEDVLNEPNTHYFDAETWFAGRVEINDFNGDGRDDALVFATDDHGDLDGGHYTDRTPLKIIYFNDDATINISRIGDPTSTHDLTSFDLDQDGDVDIVNFEWWMKDGTPNHPEVPLFYINDGSGNFTVQDTNFLEAEFYKSKEFDYIFTAVESFDLDNDGFMDIIAGYDNWFQADYCDWDTNGNSNCFDVDFSQDIRVFWGNSEGTFTEENQTRIDLPNNSYGTNNIVLGFGFIDVDNDGLYDLVANGSNGTYSGGFVRLYRNDGNRNFKDQTNQRIAMNEWVYANSAVSTGDIPLFYYPVIVDVNNDGLYDIMPYEINTGGLSYDHTIDEYSWETNVGAYMYWQNQGGSFMFMDDRLDYPN